MGRVRKDDKKRKTFTTRIEIDLYKQIKHIATDDDVDFYEVVEAAVRDYIEKRTSEKKRG